MRGKHSEKISAGKLTKQKPYLHSIISGKIRPRSASLKRKKYCLSKMNKGR